MKIVMFGAPGAGKGTISKELESMLDLHDPPIQHVSTGDLLRQAVRDGSDLGKKVEALMGTGSLISDDIMDELVKEQLSKIASYLLDGYPRTVAQAECYLGFDKPSAVVVLAVTDEVVVQRLLRRAEIEARNDDTEEVIKKRLEIYRQETMPILDYFRGRGIQILTVDGAESVQETTQKVIAELCKAMILFCTPKIKNPPWQFGLKPPKMPPKDWPVDKEAE